jgi:hypothetical protein
VTKRRELPIVGWREWVALPDLGVQAVKAKVDTGARSSSLHAFDLEVVERDGTSFVRFGICPYQRSRYGIVLAEAEVFEERKVRSSSGHARTRPVIRTTLELVGRSWPIELTLARRDQMGFRLLLGREAVRNRMLVDSGRSYYGGRPPKAIRRPKGFRS